jgi:hypothetical protein
MNITSRSSSFRRSLLAVFLVTGVFASALHGGPPLICDPYAIGEAKSLPGGRERGTDPRYDRANLVNDTLALLATDTPVLVRMETLRRAAIYATGHLRAWREGAYTPEDRALAAALIERLRQRAQQADDATRALALFDLGFFAETLRQTELDPALDGYALLLKAAEMRADDAAIQFALALASVRPQRTEHAAHLSRARAAADSSALLAANLRSHFGP